jgi:hypothetical protein
MCKLLLNVCDIPHVKLLSKIYMSQLNSVAKVKVFRYKPDVALGVPGG